MQDIRLILLLALFGSIAVTARGADLVPPRFVVGKPAPALTANSAVNGKPTTLADLKGKVVLLHFWAVWCQPCRALFPDLNEWHEKHHKQGLEVIGVTRHYQDFTLDEATGKLGLARTKLTPEQERRLIVDFAERYALKYRLFLLTAGQAEADYGADRLPLTVLIDRRGVIRMVKVGSGKAHRDALDAMLRELLAEKTSLRPDDSGEPSSR